MVTCTYYLNPPAAISINGWKYQPRHYCAYANGLPFLFCQRVLPFTLNIKLLNPRVNFWRTNYMNSLQQVICKLWFIYYLASSMSFEKYWFKNQYLPSKHFLFSKTSRCLEDVFKTYLQYVFLKRLQDVFKTCLQDVLQLCLQDVLEDKKNVTLKTSSRRLQYVFTKTNVCWVFT